MSIADLITSIATTFDGKRLDKVGGALCEITAVFYWYGAWASWMWMGGYAYALNRCLRGAFAVHTDSTPVGLRVRPLGRRCNLALHLVCWGVPLLMVVSVYMQHDAVFGQAGGDGDGATICTLTATQSVRIAYASLLWIVMAYGAFVFISVQWRLCSSVAEDTRLMRASQRQAAYRRITLWPQFLMYILVFLLSQAPGVVVSSTDRVDYPEWVYVTIAALANVHGLLNALTYGLTNAEVYVHWLPSGLDVHGGAQDRRAPLCSVSSPFVSDSGLPNVVGPPMTPPNTPAHVQAGLRQQLQQHPQQLSVAVVSAANRPI